MAAQTSPDAHIPVFFALMKLETVHLLRDILFSNVSVSQIGPKISENSNEQLLNGGMEGDGGSVWRGRLGFVLTECLFRQFTTRWKWVKLDNTLGPYWDLFVIGLIVAVLIFLLRNRYR